MKIDNINGKLLYEDDAETLRETVENAVKAGRSLSRANLSWADLSRANLSEANLSRTTGLPEAPTIFDLDGKTLAEIDAKKILFDMGGWCHETSCGTTYCRAGAAVHLAGEAGEELQIKYGYNVAGALIYNASYPGMRAPDWYATNEEALADMRERAAMAAK